MIGQRIYQRRIAAGLSLRELAQQTNNYVSAQAIHKYEIGRAQPGSDVLIKLAKALGVKVEFFFRPASAEVTLSEPAYRKRSAASSKERQSLRARAKELVEKYLEIESLFPNSRFSFKLPSDSQRMIRRLDDIETFARSLRKQWALGIDPIENLSEVLEDRGVKVAMVYAEKGIDGLSCWANDEHPVVLVKKSQPSDRFRFSLAHELGHLLLRVSKSIDEEKAANRFAGAFLVPAEAAKAELGEHRRSFSFYELLGLREKYGMSVQAWIYRARDLRIISDSFFVQLCRDLKRRGLYDKEIGKPLPSEQPKRFERLVVQAVEEGLISAAKGAEVLDIPLNEFRKKLEVGALDAEMRA
ncbi:MAG: DNA-binding protein [Bacteroidia bacterium]|nr:MAG: DNA-binding protein [Bacteroidia bacterium]